MWWIKDRRRAQAGTTLVELMVALAIASLALALVVGTFSTGLLDSTLAKRNTAAQGVLEYEMEEVTASSFSAGAPSYSDCFATENPTSPTPAAGFQGACPAGPYTLRADATWQWLPSSTSVQVWTISITSWPDNAQIGKTISVYKVDR